MSSGDKNLVMNALERALSTDINRLQQFLGAMESEWLRALINTGCGTDDLDAGGLYVPNTTTGTPSVGEVIAGILFQPTGNSSASVIGPGVLAIYDPDTVTSADDSQFKRLVDPGTTGLVLTGNPSGSLRIDVIECSRVQPDTIIETDSRDVFVPSTGTFTAVTINKVAQAQLQYRIRLGTPGGGFPGGALGWLPLVVASVPNGTTIWDTVTLWDVRPLLEDRIFNLTRASRDLPKVSRCVAQINAGSISSTTRGILTGNIEAELGGRRVGGVMRAGTPNTLEGVDAFLVDLDDPQNQSTGGVPTTGFNYVYVCTPFGLPRWAKYTAGPSGRVPRSPRGIIFNSPTPPNLTYGTPSVALNLPPCLQNTGNTATDLNAVCVLARLGSLGGSPSSLIASGRRHDSLISTATNTGTSSTHSAIYTLTAGVDFPAHARAIYVAFTGPLVTLIGSTSPEYTIDAGQITIAQVSTIQPLATVNTQRMGAIGLPLSGGTPYEGTQINFTTSARLPVPPSYALVGVPGVTPPGASVTFQITWTPVVTASGTWEFASTASPILVVQGWELLDAD